MKSFSVSSILSLLTVVAFAANAKANVTQKVGDVEYIIEYGENELQIIDNNLMNLTILPPTPEYKDGQGVRLHTVNRLSSGQFCGDVNTFTTVADGPVFAMYLADGPPPADRNTAFWQEIDFEWRHRFPNEYWTNYYNGTLAQAGGDHRGTSTPITYVEKQATTGQFHRYCMTWYNNGTALWTIKPFGKQKVITVREEHTGKPWREMYGYISIWAGETNGWNGNMTNFTTSGTSQIKNIQFTAL